MDSLKPALMMVAVQVAFGGLNVLYKLATNDGMRPEIIVAYRFIFAAAFMTPLAFLIERFNLSYFCIIINIILRFYLILF